MKHLLGMLFQLFPLPLQLLPCMVHAVSLSLWDSGLLKWSCKFYLFVDAVGGTLRKLHDLEHSEV